MAGQFYADYFALYNAFKAIGVAGFPTLYESMQVILDYGPIWPLEHLTIVCDRMQSISRNENGLLHRDLGPALTYRDGTEFFYLHGVPMNREHVLTPSGGLDPWAVLAETHVERRRELIRKIGIERLLAQLKPRILDRRDPYELLEINLGPEAGWALYLKMINPSIGTFHIEGVGPGCNTIAKALQFRNAGFSISPQILT